MVCRAPAILMVCAAKLELAGPIFQLSDRCVLQARKLPSSADISDSPWLCEHASSL